MTTLNTFETNYRLRNFLSRAMEEVIARAREGAGVHELLRVERQLDRAFDDMLARL